MATQSDAQNAAAFATALRLAAQQRTVTALEVYANTPQQAALTRPKTT